MIDTVARIPMHRTAMLRTTLLTFALAIVAAFAQSALAQTTDAGGLLRDHQGRTLYVFDEDRSGFSSCYDRCAADRPAFTAAIGAEVKGQMTVHARTDHRMQWGWRGKPLYYFAGDARPGEAAGDGQGGVWHAVRVDAPVVLRDDQARLIGSAGQGR